jgi:bifunctional non-homologous end joining protein LigD
VIHQHKTGRSHFDLRIVYEGTLRTWSLLKEPPNRNGDKRLAIEREHFQVEAIVDKHFEEQAFGHGRVYIWDEGLVGIQTLSSTNLMLDFHGGKMLGTYQLRKTRWYPGNRWMLTKMQKSSGSPPKAQPGNENR